ncbi:MAG: MFS transporter [Ignavibacteria bacterium]|nr:MFS transporter [Ignavibacteria bacterium]
MENIKLGLKENWKQFTILVIVNAFVGGMIGLERSIFPEFAESIFGVESTTAILSFIIAFGITKAITNYFTGRLPNKLGRKNLLLVGWLLASPVPFILIYATNWNWVIFANVLLGLSQGLTWSSTVVMKIDLAGEKDRGLAMGLNEFAGYSAVGVIAFLSGYVANKYGITPYPFYIGIFISIVGFVLSLFWVKDTRAFVHKESTTDTSEKLDNVFIHTTFKNKTLSSVTQAGLVNNLNDGMIWGLLPIFLLSLSFNTESIGIIAAIYPAVWGIGQLFTGKMSDVYSKKSMLFWGMLIQGITILLIPIAGSFYALAILSALLGLGTALVYPTFLSAIAQATNPMQRAESIGTFRLWRDLGYAIGAIISGITADLFGVEYAIFLIGIITIFSSLIIKIRMPDKIKKEDECIEPEELKQALYQNRKIQIIDVRTKEEYEKFHIPNAINIALSELKDKLISFDKGYQYITVSEKGGGRSSDGAKLLNELGYAAIWLCGGISKWLKVNK